jgi:NitT/TauT family transport system substrate-binding protein
VKGFLRALVKGVRDTVADPPSAVEGVVKRHDVARKDVELERLKMVLDQNIVTPWVQGERPGRASTRRASTRRSTRSA